MSERLGETMLVWNGNVARVPALVVRPQTVEEVAAAVRFAHDHGLQLDIRSENPVRVDTSTDERTVTVDLSELEA